MKIKAFHIEQNCKGETQEKEVIIITILSNPETPPIAVYIDKNGGLNDDYIYNFKVKEL